MEMDGVQRAGAGEAQRDESLVARHLPARPAARDAHPHGAPQASHSNDCPKSSYVNVEPDGQLTSEAAIPVEVSAVHATAARAMRTARLMRVSRRWAKRRRVAIQPTARHGRSHAPLTTAQTTNAAGGWRRAGLREGRVHGPASRCRAK